MEEEKSISGHGVFIYDARQTIQRYGSIEQVAIAVEQCNMQHAWVRIHGATQTHADTPTLPLIRALQNRGIAVAGWGWCQGANIEMETELAITSLREFHLDHYIADIEDGVSNANWTVNEVRTFLGNLRDSLHDTKIGVSSFGFIPWQKPELMAAADEFVDFFAPQIYWFMFPNNRILDAVGASVSEFPLNNPASYARLCIREWKKVVTKPLVVAGQAYWGEVPEYVQGTAEAKLQSFLHNFRDWDELQGFNWWHLGGHNQAAMSFAMYEAIKAARLNVKFGGSPPLDETASEEVAALEENAPREVAAPRETIREYAVRSASDGSCTTEGVIGLSEQIFEVLQPLIGGNLVSCADIVQIVGQSTIPFLQPAAKRALEAVFEEMGEKPKLIHAYRTVAQQYVLYRWFRTGNCRISLAAEPGSSPHEQGIAIDIQEYSRWRNVMARHGWHWRGDTDPGHFTYIRSDISASVRKESIRAFQRLWNRNNPHDIIQDDGTYGDVETGPRLLKSPVDGW